MLKSFFVSGGFAEINSERCIVLAEDVNELAKLVNFDKIETKIHKWKYAKPKHVLNYFFKQAKLNPNLIISGEIFGGAKLEGAFLSGINTANYLVNNRVVGL